MIIRQLRKTLNALQWKKNKKLALIDAEKRVRWLRIIAIPSMTIAIILLCLGAIKFIYFLPWQEDSLSAFLGRPIRQIIEALYISTQFLSMLWKISPLPMMEPINSLGNFYMAFLLCVVTIAKLILTSTNHLSGRIKRARQKAEEREWTDQIDGKNHQDITQYDITSIELKSEPKDKWHTRPAGIIMLAVASGVLLQIVNLALGLM